MCVFLYLFFVGMSKYRTRLQINQLAYFKLHVEEIRIKNLPVLRMMSGIKNIYFIRGYNDG